MESEKRELFPSTSSPSSHLCTLFGDSPNPTPFAPFLRHPLPPLTCGQGRLAHSLALVGKAIQDGRQYTSKVRLYRI